MDDFTFLNVSQLIYYDAHWQHWEKCLNFAAKCRNVYQTFSTEFGAKILHLHWASVDS